MKESAGSIGPKISALLKQIYPDLDRDILSSMVIDAFWPGAADRRQRARVPGNTLWSQKDALLITYG
ncbi:MAG: alpha-amylase, partial [Planktotalea sp.]